MVPDWAMVPMLASTSSMVMPMPLSRMVRVPASRSGISLIFQSGSFSRIDESMWDSKRALSMASDALEISSRTKISLLE